MPNIPKNYYQILEIAPSATNYQIQQAYEKLATYWHPDRHPVDTQYATHKFH